LADVQSGDDRGAAADEAEYMEELEWASVDWPQLVPQGVDLLQDPVEEGF
jgi:hypothetical protein